MSSFNKEQFNIYFPVFLGFVLGVLGTCIWYFIKPKVLRLCTWICPCARDRVSSDPSSREIYSAVLEVRRQVQETRQDIEERLRLNAETMDRVYAQRPSGQIMAGFGITPANAQLFTGLEMGSSGEESSDIAVAVTNELHIAVLEENQASNSASLPATASQVFSTVTAYSPTGVPTSFVARIYEFISRLATGEVHMWRSSIVIQASVSIDSRVLAEIEEFAKNCISVEKRFTLQVGEWGIFSDNGHGSFQLIRLNRGDVPVNVEARRHKRRTAIVVHGLYLNGAVIKAATMQTSTTLRSTGPPTQGRGDLDKLHIPTEGLDIEKSLIHASKVVEVDGFSIVVRSQASFVVPPREKPTSKVALWNSLPKILPSTMKMKSLLGLHVHQPKTTQSRETRSNELRKDMKSILDSKNKHQLLVEYWKGVSQSEMLECRNNVLLHLQQLAASKTASCSDLHLPTRISSSDQEYWRRGLRDMDEVIRTNVDSSQSSTPLSVRARIKFFLGEYESALQDLKHIDFHLTCMESRPSFSLLERAIIKCVLARYSEAVQDVVTAAAINPNLNDVNKYLTCLQQILHHERLESRLDVYEPLLQQSQLSNEQFKPLRTIPDLLTGDEWHPDPHSSIPCRSSYYSTRIKKLMEQRRMLEGTTDVEFQVEASKSHWSELACFADSTSTEQQDSLMAEREVLGRLSRLPKSCKWAMPVYDSANVGKKIAEGAQAEIFEIQGDHLHVIKVFKRGSITLEQLQLNRWRLLQKLEANEGLSGASPAMCTTLGMIFLEYNRLGKVCPRFVGCLRPALVDQRTMENRNMGLPFDIEDRLGMVYPRYNGDLRTLIDQRMMENRNMRPPFDIDTAVEIMLQIAQGMATLHSGNIVHRDLKCSNILFKRMDWGACEVQCHVADFECSVGVVGTGFWRAPEILQAVKDGSHMRDSLFTVKADVYSYAMTCYEVLTGKLPFEDFEGRTDILPGVLSGLRPPLHSSLHPALVRLIEHCWHTDPKQRPSFSFICERLRWLTTTMLDTCSPESPPLFDTMCLGESVSCSDRRDR